MDRIQHLPVQMTGIMSRVDEWCQYFRGEAGDPDIRVSDGPSLLLVEQKQTEWGVDDVIVINPLMTLYREERAHLVKVSQACIAAGVARMQVAAFIQIAQAQSEQVFKVLENVASDPRLVSVQKVLNQVIGEQITALAANSRRS
jgi:hypothetical protein